MVNRQKSEGVTMEYKIEVVFSRKFYDQINWYSHNYAKEIGGFIIGEVKDGVAYCEDIIYPKQHVSSGEVEFKAGAIGLLRKQEGEEKIAKIIGEWHSHNSLGCFWSGVDETLMSEFMMDFKLGIFVVSSKGNHLVRAETSKPWTTVIDNLEYEVEKDTDEVNEKEIELKTRLEELTKEIEEFKSIKDNDLKTELLKVIDDKVEERVYTKNVTKDNGFTSNGSIINGFWKNFDNFTDRDWEIYGEEYMEKYGSMETDTISEDKDFQLEEIYEFNNEDMTIKLENINPEWREEVEITFGIELSEDLVDNSLGAVIKCSNKQQFREQKKEVEGLLRLLIDEQSDKDYFSGK